MSDASVEVQADDGQVRVELAGDIDMTNADSVGERLTSAVSNRTVCLELDLTGVTYIDSAGLRTLSVLAGKLQRLQIELRVLAPIDSPARYVIDLSGMTEFLGVDQAGDEQADSEQAGDEQADGDQAGGDDQPT